MGETQLKLMWMQSARRVTPDWDSKEVFQLRWLPCLLFLVIGSLIFTEVAVAEDLLGVYFDQVAGVDSFETTVDDEIVTMYLTIVSPSSTEPIEEYVGTVAFRGASQWDALSPWGCGIVWIYPTAFVSCVGVSPMPNTGSVVVLEYQLRVPTPSTRVDVLLKLNQVSGPYYVPFGSTERVQLLPTSGDFDVPVAVINGGAVGVSMLQWGSVKSQYH